MSFKISGGVKENGIVVGNAYDKYGSKNPVIKWIMKGFESALSDFVERASPSTIHKISWGEGYWIIRWNEMGIAARGCDLSKRVIEIARDNATANGLGPALFDIRSIYDIESGRDSADLILIVCCEVFEHLKNPEAGLEALQRVAIDSVIVSVPREPIWCALNIIRGKYLGAFGNAPGHIQHWFNRSFIDLVSRYFHDCCRQNPFAFDHAPLTCQAIG